VNFLEFPSVKFHKIWQTVLLIYKTSFLEAVKDKVEKIKKLPLQTLLFLCLKFVSRWVRCAVKILEDFTKGNSRKSQIKP